MSASIIDGKQLSKTVRSDLKKSAEDFYKNNARKPKLAVVLVGENPASKVYVASKSRLALKTGIEPLDVKLPSETNDQELQECLVALSSDESVDGILLQLPLPKHLDEYKALISISPEKDIDGLHPFNQGLLLRGEDCLRPCTPLGCIELIKKARIDEGNSADLTGLNAVVVGRSVLVGKPLSLLLLEENCTVTLCHSRTKDLSLFTKNADILIAAVGKSEMIGPELIKEGSIVIDVGINRLEDGRLVGDVNYEAALSVSGSITPVPGGVGPMTIAMLLSNTLKAAKNRI